MSGSSNIAWTNATWNPTRGCERVSEGCRKCYAEVLAARHSYPAKDGKPAGWGHGLAKWVTRPDDTREARWTGKMQLMTDMLDWPLRRRAPSRIFVNSMSDLFHQDVPFEFAAAVFGVMALCPEHTFQILTKRPDRMLEFMTWIGAQQGGAAETCGWHARKQVSLAASRERSEPAEWPLENVWLGVSAEDQKEFDERVELLGQVPAAIRFVSAEPLLGWIDVGNAFDDAPDDSKYQPLDWVIVGGESGQDFRPMDIEAARWLLEQCRLSKKPVFLKQDNGPRPGLQGRFTAEEWVLKEYPR